MMIKKNNVFFFPWLNSNCQNNDVVNTLENKLETKVINVKDKISTLVSDSALKKEKNYFIETVLSKTNAETAVFNFTPVTGVAICNYEVKQNITKTISCIKQLQIWKKYSFKKKLTSTFATTSSEDDIVSLSIPLANFIASQYIQNVNAALMSFKNFVLNESTKVDQKIKENFIVSSERTGFFNKLRNSLLKTRQNLECKFIRMFHNKKIDDNLFEELEEQLIIADVGIETTRKIINKLITNTRSFHIKDAEMLYSQLRINLTNILKNVEQPLEISRKIPFIIMIVGVNGVGKTTTIGKLARQYQMLGKSVMLAAGDTFRPAAVDQLQVWGKRNHVQVVTQQIGADSASVIFEAIKTAKIRGIDVLIADTAGRLQNKTHLMEELKKIIRVVKKLDIEAPHEVMLILDASTGQNAVNQTYLFNEAVGLTGITLTKLDGTAKGGVIFSVADRFGIPIRYICIGENIEDLHPFNTNDFITSLLPEKIKNG